MVDHIKHAVLNNFFKIISTKRLHKKECVCTILSKTITCQLSTVTMLIHWWVTVLYLETTMVVSERGLVGHFDVFRPLVISTGGNLAKLLQKINIIFTAY